MSLGRVVSLAAVVLLVVGCASGGQGSTGAKKFKVAVNLSLTDNEWQQEALNLIKAEAATPPYDGMVELRVDIAGQDASKQIQTLENEVAAGVNAVIMYPVSPTALSPAITKACDQGVVVFVYGGAVTAPCAHFVGEDFYSEAYNKSAWLVNQMASKGFTNLVVVRGFVGNEAENEQERGLAAALKLQPSVKVVATVDGNWDLGKIRTAFASALASHPDIQGVWLSFGCDQVYQVLQSKGKPMVFCTGGATNDERRMLLPKSQGGLDAPMVSGSASVTPGEIGFILAIQKLQGKQVPKRVILPTPAHTVADLQVGTDPAKGANVYETPGVVPAGFWPDIWNPMAEQGLQAALTGKPDKVSDAKPCSEVSGCTQTF